MTRCQNVKRMFEKRYKAERDKYGKRESFSSFTSVTGLSKLCNPPTPTPTTTLTLTYLSHPTLMTVDDVNSQNKTNMGKC